VGLRSEGLQVAAGKLGAGHGKKLLFDASLLAEVGIAKNGWRRGLSPEEAGSESQKDWKEKLPAYIHQSNLFESNGNRGFAAYRAMRSGNAWQ
jgi:hypothetical protein